MLVRILRQKAVTSIRRILLTIVRLLHRTLAPNHPSRHTLQGLSALPRSPHGFPNTDLSSAGLHPHCPYIETSLRRIHFDRGPHSNPCFQMSLAVQGFLSLGVVRHRCNNPLQSSHKLYLQNQSTTDRPGVLSSRLCRIGKAIPRSGHILQDNFPLPRSCSRIQCLETPQNPPDALF